MGRAGAWDDPRQGSACAQSVRPRLDHSRAPIAGVGPRAGVRGETSGVYLGCVSAVSMGGPVRPLESAGPAAERPGRVGNVSVGTASGQGRGSRGRGQRRIHEASWADREHARSEPHVRPRRLEPQARRAARHGDRRPPLVFPVAARELLLVEPSRAAHAGFAAHLVRGHRGLERAEPVEAGPQGASGAVQGPAGDRVHGIVIPASLPRRSRAPRRRARPRPRRAFSGRAGTPPRARCR